MIEIFRIIFDRRHVKDPRNWVMIMLFISFGIYHKVVVMPLQERQSKVWRKTKNIIKAAHLEAKMDALEKGSGGNE